MDEQFDQLTELKLGKGEKVQALFNKLMKKTEKLDITEAQKVALFKRGLPKYIKRYIKQERPTTLLDTLQKAKEAEELGPDHDGHEDIKGLQDSMSQLLARLDPQANPQVSAMTTQELLKCYGCGSTQHLYANCPTLQQGNTRQGSNKQGNHQQDTQHQKPVCGYCGIVGHPMLQCRK